MRVSVPATPELPLPPAPTGKLTVVPVPTSRFHSGEIFDRYEVSAYVSPDASDRKIAPIPSDGKLLARVQRGDARIGPVRDLAEVDVGDDGPGQPQAAAESLGVIRRVVADSAHGTWTQLWHALAWSDVSGASDAPKSTVRVVIAWTPPPEPIGLYDRSSPRSPRGGVQAETSG